MAHACLARRARACLVRLQRGIRVRHCSRAQKPLKRSGLARKIESHTRKVVTNVRDQLCPGRSHAPLAILAAVSGGSDSMAMMEALAHMHRLSEGDAAAFDLHVVTFDHGLRGEASAADARFVAQTVEERYDGKFPVHTRVWEDHNVPPRLKGMQDQARRWRSGEYVKLASELSPDYEHVVVGVGHQSDDAIETTLLKLLRGTSLLSLGSMDTMARGEDGIIRVRPLLPFTRGDLRQYLDETGLTWREDETNSTNKSMRNRVRNVIIPALSTVAGSPEALARRIAELSRQVDILASDVDTHLHSDPKMHICKARAPNYKPKSLKSQRGRQDGANDQTLSPDVFRINTAELRIVEMERLRRFLHESKGGAAVPAPALHTAFAKLEGGGCHRNTKGGFYRIDLGDGYTAFIRKGHLTVKNTASDDSKVAQAPAATAL